MRRFPVWFAVGGCAAMLALPRPASAQGFSVNEHSSCAMGRAGTAVADPCPDGSAIFYNPAGLVSTGRGWVISGGGTFIAPNGSFTNDITGLQSDLNNKVFPVPAVYIAHGVTKNVAAGLGLFAPYGLTTDWPATSEGRYLGYKSVIRAIYLQPTVAAKLGQYVKVGAGFDLDFFHVQLRQRVDLSTQHPIAGNPLTFANLGIPTGTDFADINLHGNSTGAGFHVGIIVQPDPRVSFGARYLSRQKVTVDNGTADISQVLTGIQVQPNDPFNQVLGLPPGSSVDTLVLGGQFQGAGPLTSQTGKTAVRLPEQWAFGAMLQPIDRLKVLFDITLQNWTVFDTLVISLAKLAPLQGPVILPQNFGRTTTWRFGGEYALSPRTEIRAGYLRHNAAEPTGSVTPNLPEGDRAEVTAGVGTKLGGALHVDLAYQYIDQQARRGRTVPFGQPDNGLFKFKAHLFGATLTYSF